MSTNSGIEDVEDTEDDKALIMVQSFIAQRNNNDAVFALKKE
jgi:hypothetical protein